MPVNPSAFLTTTDAAAALGITRQHISDLARSGLIPGAVKMGRDWFIPPSCIETLRGRPDGRKGRVMPARRKNK